MGLPWSYDVCDEIPLHQQCVAFDPSTPDQSFCTPSCSCMHGEGDCDDDFDCGGSLVCIDDTGAAVRPSPDLRLVSVPGRPRLPDLSPVDRRHGLLHDRMPV